MARPADPLRRETILNAAKEVFLEQGYSESRLADIASRAGVVISTLYLYYDSKEEMVRALAERGQRNLGEQLVPALAQFRGRDDLERLVTVVLDFAATHRDEIRLLILDSGLRSVPLGQGNYRGPNFPLAVRHFQNLMEQGYVRPYDPTMLLELLAGFIRWTMTTYIHLSEQEVGVLKETCLQWLSHALLPSEL